MLLLLSIVCLLDDDFNLSADGSSVLVLGGKTNVPFAVVRTEGNDSNDDSDVVFMKSRYNLLQDKHMKPMLQPNKPDFLRVNSETMLILKSHLQLCASLSVATRL